MTHYLINGLKYARVSHVISQFHPTDKVFPAAVAGVRSAAELGTEMHENIEAYLKGSQTHFEARPQLQAFLAAHVAGKWEFFSSEERIWDPEWRIAGTVDALFYNRVADNYLLVDWKRTRMLYDDSAVQYQLQLNIYQRILARMGRPVVLAGLALLHPRNHGFMWVPVPDIDVSLYVENARYLSEGAAIEEKGQYKRTKASVCGKMDMIKRFFMKDPQVASAELHAIVKAHDFEARTNAVVAERKLRDLDRKILVRGRTFPADDGLLKLMNDDRKALMSKERMNYRACNQLHKAYNGGDTMMRNLAAIETVQQIADVCASVQPADTDAIRVGTASRRHQLRTEMIINQIDENMASDSDDDGGDGGGTTLDDDGGVVFAAPDVPRAAVRQRPAAPPAASA